MTTRVSLRELVLQRRALERRLAEAHRLADDYAETIEEISALLAEAGFPREPFAAGLRKLIAERDSFARAGPSMKDMIEAALEERKRQFGGGMIPFDIAYFDALKEGRTPAEAARAGVDAALHRFADDLIARQERQ